MILRRTLFFIVFFSFSGSVFKASVKGIVSPYDAIRYHEAFDQEEIYEKYKELMHILGCSHNVFCDTKDDKVILKNKRCVLSEEDALLGKQIAYELEKYQEECLKQLDYARFIALAEPGIESGIYITLGALAAAATMYYMGKDSAGGSYSGYSAIFSAAYELSGLGKSLYNLIFLPNNSLGSLENYFAKNKCFIPRVLWSKITNAFIDARQSDALKEKSINFLKFSLGFTLYKFPLKNIFTLDRSAQDIKDELNRRIDRFFNEYNVSSKELTSLTYIKINVAKFIDSLIDSSSVPARYIYLHGLGGIGKTHFVQTLADWFEELMPHAIYYQDLVINSIAELEGNENKPGAFLKVLRNQTMSNKIGSVIMIDEATWLNDINMISAAKRIFNGDRTRLSTAYFGSDIDGSAIVLDMPPMLIFIASNEELSDSALASRFDIVQYPLPTQQTLINYAYKIAQQSSILNQQSLVITYESIVDWITSLDSKNLNFRYIAGNIENYCLHNS